MTRQPDGLFPAPKPPKPPRADAGGPVYQGVCKQIRALFPEKDPDEATRLEAIRRKATLEGTIAQARDLARRVDQGSDGAVGTAALHDTLDKLLERLSPDAGDSDPFQELLNALKDNDTEGAPGVSDATPAHPEV